MKTLFMLWSTINLKWRIDKIFLPCHLRLEKPKITWYLATSAHPDQGIGSEAKYAFVLWIVHKAGEKNHHLTKPPCLHTRLSQIKRHTFWAMLGHFGLISTLLHPHVYPYRITGCPRAICGQRYPLPCFAWLGIAVRGSRAAAPKGTKSCRTQGDFCSSWDG